MDNDLQTEQSKPFDCQETPLFKLVKSQPEPIALSADLFQKPEELGFNLKMLMKQKDIQKIDNQYMAEMFARGLATIRHIYVNEFGILPEFQRYLLKQAQEITFSNTFKILFAAKTLLKGR